MIITRCKGCGASLEAEDDMAGMAVECPKCGKNIFVERAPSKPAQQGIVIPGPSPYGPQQAVVLARIPFGVVFNATFHALLSLLIIGIVIGVVVGVLTVILFIVTPK